MTLGSPLDHTDYLTELATWLAGEFDNREQALAEPTWFVSLRLWHRPLPIRLDGHRALFAEQANLLHPDQPYRQRVLILQPSPGQSIGQVEYRAFHHPDRVRGAGANPALLESLSPNDLQPLPGCRLHLSYQNGTYEAVPDPSDRCCFQYDGKKRQVILRFMAQADRFWSGDRGVDPTTGQSLWGALMGDYTFQKRTSYPLLT